MACSGTMSTGVSSSQSDACEYSRSFGVRKVAHATVKALPELKTHHRLEAEYGVMREKHELALSFEDRDRAALSTRRVVRPHVSLLSIRTQNMRRCTAAVDQSGSHLAMSPPEALTMVPELRQNCHNPGNPCRFDFFFMYVYKFTYIRPAVTNPTWPGSCCVLIIQVVEFSIVRCCNLRDACNLRGLRVPRAKKYLPTG